MMQLTLPEPSRRTDESEPLFAPPHSAIPWCAVEANRLARSSDGPGSHAAAERIVRSGKAASARQRVLDAIKRYPGRTSSELGKIMGTDRYLPGRRCSDLYRMGLVKRTAGEAPDHEWRWWPA